MGESTKQFVVNVEVVYDPQRFDSYHEAWLERVRIINRASPDEPEPSLPIFTPAIEEEYDVPDTDVGEEVGDQLVDDTADEHRERWWLYRLIGVPSERDVIRKYMCRLPNAQLRQRFWKAITVNQPMALTAYYVNHAVAKCAQIDNEVAKRDSVSRLPSQVELQPNVAAEYVEKAAEICARLDAERAYRDA